jgi:hypothetical protein
LDADYELAAPLACGTTWLDCCVAFCIYVNGCAGVELDRSECIAADCGHRLENLNGPITRDCLETSAAFYDCVSRSGEDECLSDHTTGSCANEFAVIDCPRRAP